MKVKVPNEIRIGAYKYKVEFNSHLCYDSNWAGSCCHREAKIVVDSLGSRQTLDITLIHEILHMIDKNYSIHIEEDNIDRIACGIMEFLTSLGIELDWSNIKEETTR